MELPPLGNPHSPYLEASQNLRYSEKSPLCLQSFVELCPPVFDACAHPIKFEGKINVIALIQAGLDGREGSTPQLCRLG
jgi:hypothetical protein